MSAPQITLITQMALMMSEPLIYADYADLSAASLSAQSKNLHRRLRQMTSEPQMTLITQMTQIYQRHHHLRNPKICTADYGR
jgi:hypothetical protein